MPILDEIEAFFAGQPEWQQRGYAALRSGQVVNDSLIGELATACISEASSQSTKSKRKPQTPTQNSTSDALPVVVVRLLGIENVQRINRLASQQSLKLAADGLTVVYGDNGAGKTGYGRIVRQVCQARGSAPALHGNVFQASQPSGSADIVFSVNGTEDRLTIRSGQSQACPLRHFSIFDTSAANSLVNEQNATAFRPFGLDLLDKFTALADAVKHSIEREISQTETPFVQLSDFPETTKAGRFLRELGSASDRNALEAALTPLTTAQNGRAEELRTLLLQAKANDPAKLAQSTNAKATRYQQFVQRLERIVAGLAAEKTSRFAELRIQTDEAETAAEIARTKAFGTESLKEVGAPVWRQLWDAARAYSLDAGAGQPLANAQSGDLCTLCAQPLSPAAAGRLQTLESFVKGELQAKAKNLRKQLNSALVEFNELPLQQLGDDALLQELATDSKDAATETAALLTQGREALRVVQAHHATGEPVLGEVKIRAVPTTLSNLVPTLRLRAVELQKATTVTALSAFQAELAELDASAKLVQQAAQVRKEAARLARRGELEKAKKFNTRGVTDLSKRLTTQYVSEALCNRFRDEVSRLGLGHLEVRLSPSDTQKGQLFHRLTLKAEQDAPLREVVSEGEFRCLALAAFLAESGGNTSGILFDDPVSSLDHTWRGQIANRLAEEARTRQVVVFTHDIAFHFLLREAAESAAINVPFAERCVERRGNAGSGFCREDAPWAGMKTSKRIGVLKTDLIALKVEHDTGHACFERNIRDWYGRLRESWERAIEECLLNDAVRRFGHSVQTNRLEKALQKLQPGDWPAIEKGMTRASASIRGHDGAAGLNPPIPTPDAAKADLAEFEAWVKTKN